MAYVSRCKFAVYRHGRVQSKAKLGYSAMSGLQDLSPCIYLPVVADHILAVGWLDSNMKYGRGSTPTAVYQKLKDFVRSPWQPFLYAGHHECNLCQFHGESHGASNLFIPFEGKIYVAPELITHYINAHHYQPPAIFCDAVLACPSMDTIEFKRHLIACNGRVLWSPNPT
jgi:hypothetical protein